MELFFRPKFTREYRSIKNKEVIAEVIKIFQQVEGAKAITDIGGRKKLENYAHYYRIKIKISEKNDYRLVLMIRNNKVSAEHIALATKIFYKQ